AVVSALVTDEIERGHAVVIAGDSFAVDNTGARAQACQRLDDQREAAGGIVARTGVEAHPRGRPAGNDTGTSCLVSWRPRAPDGSLPVLVGRHGAMNPAGTVRCNMTR